MKAVILTTIITLACSSIALAKKGVAVTHYGSSNDETRALTINKITDEISKTIPGGIPVTEAYISPMVRKNMSRKDIKTLSPEEAFLNLQLDGVDTLIVQPSLIIDGGEMDEVRKAIESVKPFFKHIELGRPLCYTPADFQQVIEILSKENADGADAVIFVGHGNELPSTATYTQLDYMLADSGKSNYHVSTIEGYPTAESTIRQLKRSPKKIKNVKLVPFLLVCGNHTREDIAGEYTKIFNDNGLQTNLLMRGLGELQEIRDVYRQRVIDMLETVK